MTATQDEAAPFDARPVYRIAVFGLGPRFQRLLEIIVKHARHNNYRYQVAEHRGPGEFDIALVDMTAKGGAEVARTLKSVPQALPVIGVGRRANHRRGNDDLLLATFSLDVLGVLNRAAESLSMRERTRRLSTQLVQADHNLRAAADRPGVRRGRWWSSRARRCAASWRWPAPDRRRRRGRRRAGPGRGRARRCAAMN